MKIWMIDTENVGANWINKVNIKKDDKILLFYTVNSAHIAKENVSELAKKLKGSSLEMNKKRYSYEELQYLIINNKINFEVVKCVVGKNALDFQLVSYLGMLIFENPDAEFLIVSDDQGFDAVVSMWSKRQISVKRYHISSKGIAAEKTEIIIKPRTTTEIISVLKKNKNKVKEEVNLIFTNESEETINTATEYFVKYYFYNKEVFKQSLKVAFGKNKGEFLDKKIHQNADKILSNCY